MTADESTATVQSQVKNALELSSGIFDKKNDEHYLYHVFNRKCKNLCVLLTFVPFLNVAICTIPNLKSSSFRFSAEKCRVFSAEKCIYQFPKVLNNKFSFDLNNWLIRMKCIVRKAKIAFDSMCSQTSLISFMDFFRSKSSGSKKKIKFLDLTVKKLIIGSIH